MRSPLLGMAIAAGVAVSLASYAEDVGRPALSALPAIDPDCVWEGVPMDFRQELVLPDASRTAALLQRLGDDADLLTEIAQKCRIPLTRGGHIQISRVLAAKPDEQRALNELASYYRIEPAKVWAWWNSLPITKRKSFSISADESGSPTPQQRADIHAGVALLGLTGLGPAVTLARFATGRSWLERVADGDA